MAGRKAPRLMCALSRGPEQMLEAILPHSRREAEGLCRSFAAAASSRRAWVRAACLLFPGLCSQGPWSSPFWDSGWMLDENAFISIACSWPSMVPNRPHLPQVHRLAGGSADELQAEADWFEKAVDLDLTQILDGGAHDGETTIHRTPAEGLDHDRR